MEAAAVLQTVIPEFQFEQPALPEIQRHDVRFFVQTGWESLHLDTAAVPGQRLPRGIIMPCRSFQQKANKFEIPETARIKGTEERDSEGKVTWMRYWKYAKDEAERLNDIEANATHPTGLREIRSLSGREDVYTRCKINHLLYAGLDELPQTNEGMIRHLTSRLEELKTNPPASISQQDLPVVLSAVEEVLEAARANAQMQLSRIEFTHTCMKLSPREPEFKRRYDQVDLELLTRTQVKRVHDSETVMADALEILAKDKVSGGDNNQDLKDLILLMRDQMESQQKTIETLLGERSSEPKIQTKKEKN